MYVKIKLLQLHESSMSCTNFLVNFTKSLRYLPNCIKKLWIVRLTGWSIHFKWKPYKTLLFPWLENIAVFLKYSNSYFQPAFLSFKDCFSRSRYKMPKRFRNIKNQLFLTIGSLEGKPTLRKPSVLPDAFPYSKNFCRISKNAKRYISMKSCPLWKFFFWVLIKMSF